MTHSPSATGPFQSQLEATRLAFTRRAPNLATSAPLAACDDLHLARGLALMAADQLLTSGELLDTLPTEGDTKTDPLTAARTATRSAAATLLDRPKLLRSPRLRAAADAEVEHALILAVTAVAGGHGDHSQIGVTLKGVRYLTEAIAAIADGDTCTAAATTQLAQLLLGRAAQQSAAPTRSMRLHG